MALKKNPDANQFKLNKMMFDSSKEYKIKKKTEADTRQS